MAAGRNSIGILAFGRSPIQHMPFGRTRALLAEAALQGAELLFFSDRDCRMDPGCVDATLWNGSGWDTRATDLPRLVHAINRPGTIEQHSLDKWLRARTDYVAPRGLNKLDQVRLLEDSSLSAHAIPTTLLADRDITAALTDWLNAHPGGAVVKPIDGMRGGSIGFAVPNCDGWTFNTRSKPPLDGTFDEVVGALSRAIAGRARYRKFIAQRYIESKERGLPLAFRVDVSKNPDGAWSLTRAAARINVAGGFASNLHGGGAQMLLDRFLARRSPGRDKQIFSSAVDIACRVAELLEARPDVSLIELGVDLVIDATEHLWIVETNFRPDANWTEHDRAIRIIAYLRARLESRRATA
jgi:glutathione synthase/RimK-type ligase-like ATP-grasp enzyme